MHEISKKITSFLNLELGRHNRNNSDLILNILFCPKILYYSYFDSYNVDHIRNRAKILHTSTITH